MRDCWRNKLRVVDWIPLYMCNNPKIYGGIMMPLYVYKCSKCAVGEELICSVSDRDKERECLANPSCDGKLLRQVTGGAMFDLKGSGFYKSGKDAPK